MTGSDQSTGVPLRHPRPLTAAELYAECEKEQEAVVSATPYHAHLHFAYLQYSKPSITYRVAFSSPMNNWRDGDVAWAGC